MEVLARPPVVIVLAEPDAATLARQLSEAIRRGWVARSAHPPLLLLRLADQVSQAARGSALVPQNSRSLLPLSCSDQPENTLTVREAASVIGTSESYVRRLARGEAFEASRPARSSAWAIDADSFAAWAASRRRTDHNPEGG